MTTGFDQQTPTFGAICKSAPKPQALGAKTPNRDSMQDRPAEPRTFAAKHAL